MQILKSIFRTSAHLIFRTRSFGNNSIKQTAKRINNKKILELGSGKKLAEEYHYSTKQFFDNSNKFIQSDINKDFGHTVIDVTNMKYQNEYDIVICMNVLEHVFDFQKAIYNIYTALKENGTAIIYVPGVYPLHDEPNDFWRFTEHSMKKILKDFNRITIKHSGLRQFPFAYYIEAYK